MKTFMVVSQYYCESHGTIELPDGKEWTDIKHWYVKYGSFFAHFHDGTNMETLVHDESNVDWKRPEMTEVHPCNDDEEVDYETTLE